MAVEEKPRADKRKSTTLLTLQQASDQSGVPYHSLRKLVVDGYLPRVQLGNSRRTWIKRSDLERLITSSTTQTVG